jgi:hypothetical protein
MQIMAPAIGDESVRLKQWSKGEYTGANNVSRTVHTHSVTCHHLVNRSQLEHERTLQMQQQLSGAAFLYEAAAATCALHVGRELMALCCDCCMHLGASPTARRPRCCSKATCFTPALPQVKHDA